MQRPATDYFIRMQLFEVRQEQSIGEKRGKFQTFFQFLAEVLF